VNRVGIVVLQRVPSKGKKIMIQRRAGEMRAIDKHGRYV